MTAITRFEEIESWKTARQLTLLIYKLADQGAFAKDYGLRDQIRRAAVSIMSNIAEGFESRTNTQFINYLGHAKGSSGEARSQLYIAADLNYISQEQFAEAYDWQIKHPAKFADLLSIWKRTLAAAVFEANRRNITRTLNVKRLTFNKLMSKPT
jgi:four helix bundle protein